MAAATRLDYRLAGPGEKEAIWHFGGLVEIALAADDTGGALALLDELGPRGMHAPLHVHSREDETFHVVEGEITFCLGEREVRASSGATVFLPRGLPNAFRVDSETARFLNVITPAGLEDFFRRLSEPAARRELPPLPTERPDLDRLRSLAADFGIEILSRPRRS